MLNQIINVIIPILITAITGVLVAIVKVVGDNAVSYITEKKNAIATQVGIDNYNANLKKAKDVWNIVDEEFRITPTLEKTIEAKQQMFDKLLKEKIPSLTDDEISSLRQAIAGEVNKGKEVVTSDELAKQKELETIKTQNAQLSADKTSLQTQVDTLTNQNKELTDKINAVNNAVSTVSASKVTGTLNTEATPTVQK